jgi:hypothetical protein
MAQHGSIQATQIEYQRILIEEVLLKSKGWAAFLEWKAHARLQRRSMAEAAEEFLIRLGEHTGKSDRELESMVLSDTVRLLIDQQAAPAGPAHTAAISIEAVVRESDADKRARLARDGYERVGGRTLERIIKVEHDDSEKIAGQAQGLGWIERHDKVGRELWVKWLRKPDKDTMERATRRRGRSKS